MEEMINACLISNFKAICCIETALNKFNKIGILIPGDCDDKSVGSDIYKSISHTYDAIYKMLDIKTSDERELVTEKIMDLTNGFLNIENVMSDDDIISFFNSIRMDER